MFFELPLSKHKKVVNFLYCDKTIPIPLVNAEKIQVFTALPCHMRIKYNVQKHTSINPPPPPTPKHQVLVQCCVH